MYDIFCYYVFAIGMQLRFDYAFCLLIQSHQVSFCKTFYSSQLLSQFQLHNNNTVSLCKKFLNSSYLQIDQRICFQQNILYITVKFCEIQLLKFSSHLRLFCQYSIQTYEFVFTFDKVTHILIYSSMSSNLLKTGLSLCVIELKFLKNIGQDDSQCLELVLQLHIYFQCRFYLCWDMLLFKVNSSVYVVVFISYLARTSSIFSTWREFRRESLL